FKTFAAKTIGERRVSTKEALGALEKMAADPDPRVRLAVATACRQIVSSSLTVDTDINYDAPVGKILTKLIQSSAKENLESTNATQNSKLKTQNSELDPLIPFMIWMASEPLVAKNPEPGLKWVLQNGSDTMPL